MINKNLKEFCYDVGCNFFSTKRKQIDKKEFSLVVDKFFELHVDYEFILDTCYFYYKPLLEKIKKNNNVEFLDIDLLIKYFNYNDIFIINELFGNFPIDITKRVRYSEEDL